jgi:hypothetical protein
MEIKKLGQGKTIGVDQERLMYPKYADSPRLRAGTPASVVGNVAMGLQMAECSKLRLGNPVPTLVKVVFREIEGVLYLLLIPVNEAGPDVYDLKYTNKSKVPVVRGLKLLFEKAKITLRGDLWYDMSSELVEDQEHGLAVGGQWTNVVTSPRGEEEKDVAAAEMTEE